MSSVFNLSKKLSNVGRFKFRTSYGQNLLFHTLEDVKIGVHIAEEVGAMLTLSAWVLVSRHRESAGRRRQPRYLGVDFSKKKARYP